MSPVENVSVTVGGGAGALTVTVPEPPLFAWLVSLSEVVAFALATRLPRVTPSAVTSRCTVVPAGIEPMLQLTKPPVSLHPEPPPTAW